mmetsp:Transcript_99697/g.257611  ORF Transcript_99697/g.257611 Transcript_99697/m.257611 type:complete len:465 (+) Transcript_99697:294-1688(+)
MLREVATRVVVVLLERHPRLEPAWRTLSDEEVTQDEVLLRDGLACECLAGVAQREDAGELRAVGICAHLRNQEPGSRPRGDLQALGILRGLVAGVQALRPPHVADKVVPARDVVRELHAGLLEPLCVFEREVAGRHQLPTHLGVQAQGLVVLEARRIHIPHRLGAAGREQSLHVHDEADALLVVGAARGDHREVQVRGRLRQPGPLRRRELREELLLRQERRQPPEEVLALRHDHGRALPGPLERRRVVLRPSQVLPTDLFDHVPVVVALALRADEGDQLRHAGGLDTLAPAVRQPVDRLAEVHPHARRPVRRRLRPAAWRRLLRLTPCLPGGLVGVLPVECGAAVSGEHFLASMCALLLRGRSRSEPLDAARRAAGGLRRLVGLGSRLRGWLRGWRRRHLGLRGAREPREAAGQVPGDVGGLGAQPQSVADRLRLTVALVALEADSTTHFWVLLHEAQPLCGA